MSSNDYRLSVKRDIVFKRIFAHKGNEDFLRNFLSSLLKISIDSIEILHDIHLEKDSEEDKLGIIDVRAIVNENKIINIEVQIKNNKNIVPRSTFYGAKLISNELVKNEVYQELKPVIVICILNYENFPYEEYINETEIVLKEHKEYIVNDYMKFYYIELPKFRRQKVNYEDETTQWLTFIDSENPEGMKEIMKKNEIVKKAQEELEYLQGDEAFKRKIELREKYERDMDSAKYCGKQEGIEEGIKKGIEKGIKKGKKEAMCDTAKKLMLKNIDMETIMEITGLKKGEIENIKKDV